MPKNLDQRINDAKEALDKTEEGSKERDVALTRMDVLTELRDAGLGKSQDDMNRLDRQNKEEFNSYKTKVESVLDGSVEEFEETLTKVMGSRPDGEGDGDEDGNALKRMQAALQERDQKIDTLSTTLTDVNTRYSKDKVDAAVERAFKAAGLDEKFLAPAKSLAGYDDLVGKVTKGESVTNEEVAEKVGSVKTLSGVWFQAEGDEGEGEGGRLVAGHKLKEEPVSPGIPATPQGGGSAEITDEDRAKRASSVY